MRRHTPVQPLPNGRGSERRVAPRYRATTVRERLGALLIFTLVVNAQQIGQNTSSKEAATFKVNTKHVFETVFVKDKAGNQVGGLTATDFTTQRNGCSL